MNTNNSFSLSLKRELSTAPFSCQSTSAPEMRPFTAFTVNMIWIPLYPHIQLPLDTSKFLYKIKSINLTLYAFISTCTNTHTHSTITFTPTAWFGDTLQPSCPDRHLGPLLTSLYSHIHQLLLFSLSLSLYLPTYLPISRERERQPPTGSLYHDSP